MPECWQNTSGRRLFAAQESRSKSLGQRRIDDVVRYLGLAAPVAKVLFVSRHCKFLELCYFGCL